ncbi:MAG: Asparagine synthase (Glutamine-hydrolyzing) [Candidatus Roizmanbacteria bacterium GW2011_GWC2_37_13]|uniref:asparagine synthase (glutamine-hydrolyzing) n=1 Tax=Candidatus Roizmanbacteria bacterium GW2011_GWC2_37_13 TaxID=1618486 RepID=A0A0G0ILH3_9BACT|nr:MAG: Asparagine synthase (Glutamine-hydrolyzing) [Candidatus Roizmanbacteria bacterium GW2011_GWC1_37_12]KKQ25079.1 MAG: Asparagine synthase (Glutamine-hydrolyzing) [Candidatus Roizmanbacteria bacterium GW2011_GWC2_37_13]
MCGIAGFYGFRDDKLIKNISKQLSHRGPDGEGFFFDKDTTLLNRRLAIIDLKSGGQPIYNEDETVVVVYNGEIYNYQELRRKLEKFNHKFKTKSDTEVIVHGYEQWQEKCFDRLNGMFAIALYDKKKKKLLLVRDHFGIKPLYYSIAKSEIRNPKSETNSKSEISNTKLIFSSEIKPIFYSGLVKKQPNDRIIYRYLKYRIHDDGKETFFKDIYRLLPGELLEIRNSKFEIRKYTSLKEELISLSRHSGEETKSTTPESGQRFWTSQNDVSQFKKKLVEAIKYRLISNVPVGTCLSGGLDSSTVVSIVNKLLKENAKEAKSIGNTQKTFSAVFPGGSNDEEKYIDLLVKELTSLRVNVFKVKPNSKEFFKEIQDFVRTQEEPTISTGPYAQYKVMEKAEGKVKVLLDGQGADEMMAGYLPYYFVYLRQLYKNKNYLLFIEELTNSLDVVVKYFLEKLKKTTNAVNLLNKEFADKYKEETFFVENNNLKKRLIEDIFSNSLQSLLRYEDKNAMRFSIEGRVPFLDFNLMKYLFALPDETIIKNGWNKYILREATKDLLPKEINLRRNKIGFTTPEYQWFMEKRKEIFEIFLSKSFSERKYFNRKETLNSFQKFVDGETNDTMVFWRLINVELWLREFFDPPSHKASEDNVKKIIESKIKIKGKIYIRHLIKTNPFKKGDDYISKIGNYVKGVLEQINARWFIVISEKIIAISQGRSYFIWDIRPGRWAKFLYPHVKKTPYGIGLGSPWTMELAIKEVGVARILAATLISVLTKPLGIQGMFYRIAGETVRSIDGPTEYSLYPSNVSAKLGPRKPHEVVKNIHEALISNFEFLTSKQSSNFKQQSSNFLGVVLIDANDIGRNVLGNSTGLSNKLIEEIMNDNPMGQSNEQTPITIVIMKS